MDMCHRYSIKWRHEFNHTKCGVVTFGESKALHVQSMNEREWKMGNDIVDEVYEYKNLGVLKNYVGSFSSNVTENIEKTRKKAGMVFPPNLIDARQIFLFIWSFGSRHVCLHYYSEVNCLHWPLACHWNLNVVNYGFLKISSLYPHLHTVHWFWSCQAWTPLNPKSMSSDYYFEPKMATVVKNFVKKQGWKLFWLQYIIHRCFAEYLEALRKYGVFDYFKLWFETSVFPVYSW